MDSHFHHKRVEVLPPGNYFETYRRTIIEQPRFLAKSFENPGEKKAISTELCQRRNRTRQQQQQEGSIIIAREFCFGHGYYVHRTRKHTHTRIHTSAYPDRRREIRDLRSTVMADSPQPKQLEVRGKHRAVRSRAEPFGAGPTLFSSRSTVKAVIKYSMGRSARTPLKKCAVFPLSPRDRARDHQQETSRLPRVPVISLR